MPRTERVAGDRHAVENEIGEFGQQQAVFERSRFALVSIADDIVLPADRLAGEPPFHAGGKTGSATAPELGAGNLLYNLLRRAIEGSLDPVCGAERAGQERPSLYEARPYCRFRQHRTLWLMLWE